MSSNGYDPASRQIAMLAMVYVGANESSAESEFSQQAVWCYRALSNSADSSVTAAPVPSYEHYAALRNAASLDWKEIRESDVVIWGSPDRCMDLDILKEANKLRPSMPGTSQE